MEENVSIADDNELIELDSPSNVKKKKRGIIYLSTIPPYMNVIKVREIFGKYGDVGRVFLQPGNADEEGSLKKRKRPSKHFTEGWVEFLRKRVAKQVAISLNNKQIGSRKKSKFYDMIWNIKYLPRFKWVHLSERLAYERASHKQRMNAAISQARKEANFFQQNLDRSEKHHRKLKSS